MISIIATCKGREEFFPILHIRMRLYANTVAVCVLKNAELSCGWADRKISPMDMLDGHDARQMGRA